MCGQQGLPFVARAAPGAVYDLREGVAGVALPLQVSPRFCLPKWAAPACTHTHDLDKGAATKRRSPQRDVVDVLEAASWAAAE